MPTTMSAGKGHLLTAARTEWLAGVILRARARLEYLVEAEMVPVLAPADANDDDDDDADDKDGMDGDSDHVNSSKQDDDMEYFV